MTKNILGLDLGTNSIGWALIKINHEDKTLKIIALGSRIIPMDGQEFSKFNAGQKVESAAGKRTTLHRARITKERYLLRRDRLHLVLNLLEALPEHYKIEIDFEKNGKKCGQFKEGKEPKMAYLPTKNLENKFDFYFEEAFNEMIEDLQKVNPEIKNEKKKRVPKDWTIYFLRNKAMSQMVSLEELAWVLLSYNQKRGTDSEDFENEDEKSDEIKEKLDLKVIKTEKKANVNGDFYEITLNDAENFKYKEYTAEQLTFEDDVKEVTKILKLDDAGNIINEKTTYQISDLYNLTLANIEHTDINDKKSKHKYDFIYTNGWRTEKKKEKFDVSYQKLEKQIKEESKVITELFVVSNKYDFTGKPESVIPSIQLPDFNSEGSKDWSLLKKKTEKDVISYNISKGFVNKDRSAKHFISPKIYDILKNDAKTGERSKIIGGLFQTIDRKFYREELYQIINTQRKFHTSTLDDKDTFEKCVKLLYPHNKDHSKTLLQNKQALTNLFIEDILLYQRPLKSKKSEISDCKYEIDYWKEDVNISTGEVVEIPVYKKAVSASHPLFQEFRIWDKIHNIRLIQLESKDADGNSQTNVDITSQYFKPENYQALFNHFNGRSTVAIDDFLAFCKEQFKLDTGKKGERKILWNYPVEEEFKGNETRKSFEIRFKRCGFDGFNEFMTQQKEIELWHYLYSVSSAERKKVSQIKDSSNPKFGKTGIWNFFIKYFKDENVAPEILEKLCRDFENYPKFTSKYTSYSVKALNKMLAVMRVGENFLTAKTANEKWQEKYVQRADTIIKKNNEIDWSAESIDLKDVILNDVNVKNGEIPFPKGLFNTFKSFETVDDFHFLNPTQASYFIYGRHSELAQAKYWKSPMKIREEIMKELKHHSLNNPTAEKVLKETLNVVADIWEIYGNSEEKFFNEIHLEVARELQKSNKEKKDIIELQKNSRTENNRLRNILEEFLSSSPYNAKRGNQDHFERLKIVEDGAKVRSYSDKEFYSNNKDKFSKTDIEAIFKKQKITQSDFEKYKLWIEQGYKSPYTDQIIKLTDLFDGNKYNVDHIFSRAAITNDSLNNKVVCEAVINRFKSHRTGREFIAQFGGRTHTIFDDKLNKNVTFSLIDEDAYVSLVKSQFKDSKRLILLSKEVPKGFTESQLNNTKYIARKAMELLSHIVREEGEVEFRSKNVLPVSGAITDRLKKEWKVNQIWTELLKPRFERLNKIHNSEDFGSYTISKSGRQYFDINTKYILGENDKFDLKRLDHRHHALDALIIALCTENHVQYFNNINSGITNKKKGKMEAIMKQRAGIKRQIMYSEKDKENPNEKVWRYMLPGSFRNKESLDNEKDSVVDLLWKNSFTTNYNKDYRKTILECLENCIVSFKNDFKIVSKSSNKYESYYDENGNISLDSNGKPKKEFKSQKNENQKHWSIRKPLHTDNPSAEIKLQFDRLKVIDNLGKANLIIDEKIRDAVKEILGMHDNKIGKAESYLKKNPLILEEKKVEYADFKISNIKYRKRQPITNLSLRTGTGALPTYDTVVDRINKVSDFVLRNELLKHLEINDNDIDKAFSIEGINDFNSNRRIPVFRLPISESATLKFKIGNKNSNSHKWVETGGNFHFRITENGNLRDYETIPLRNALIIEKKNIIETQSAENNNEIVLSPNDLVYIPLKNNEKTDFNNLTIQQKKRIYKFISCTNKEAHFVPYSNSSEIIKNENGTNSKSERIQDFFDGNILLDNKEKLVQVKSVCWKLKVDRLGNLSKV
ncbi:type II CRISPR RNA-guided endonuclease Cas9 [uncultured Pedobacter sp.]|uniref:type II CRISPR RNA-guided endonuclease Cas9 n=1 Tax=uncultured Pedobacter sp. TaxID=246139 RepID=UPI0025F2FC21|nr:type II CRISPR RNA-guided endonuclease Cas9 [uncultured Pedobacter sp.]